MWWLFKRQQPIKHYIVEWCLYEDNWVYLDFGWQTFDSAKAHAQYHYSMCIAFKPKLVWTDGDPDRHGATWLADAGDLGVYRIRQ